MSEEHNTFSRQHFYAFGRNFLDAVRAEGWSYIDITEIVQKPNQYCYLVSREFDLTAIPVLAKVSAKA